MMRALCIVAMMALSATLVMAQSPEERGSAYAKSIVNCVAKGSYDAITEEFIGIYNYAMGLTSEEQEAFAEGFMERAMSECECSALGLEFADNLILHFEDVMASITDYKEGDSAEVVDVEGVGLEY
jgi:hypothetical protein